MNFLAFLAAACAIGAAGLAAPAAAADREEAGPKLSLPPVGLRARDVAVVINADDPASVEIGRYYAARRGIAADRVVRVRFPAGQQVMGFADFQRVKEALDAKLGPDVQALALAWTLPFRVECMSVTSAFAFGFDPAAHCAEGCVPTRPSAYFNSRSNAPFTDHRIRPAMLLAGNDVESAKRLIDRGLRADETWPQGKAYLLNTSDGNRNVRAESYERVRAGLAAAYPIEQVDGDALVGKSDVMFEFTGVSNVTSIDANSFLDGAIADHLTSLGGVLTGAGQTTALEWLQAGATGSYGTAIEPCNFRGKFPEVGLVMAHYLAGESLVEAYWKSVRMPGQGVFVGDPLARPFGGVRVTATATSVTFATRALPPGNYVLEAARSSVGPFQPVRALRVAGFAVRQLTLPAAETRHFRLRSVPDSPAPASSPTDSR
jgi:uncharacterized protein (TIGR03790 family)